ncbi:hypothetical protein Pcinc_010623 [Petrolisthes cinctipes]|uniref:Uncharacterized protein n=1 Tax=Petrolisthes cinctipes TaxID=88211 RepID=A0AAE1KTE9_PETCI|nr:hypothetical protein Pcinc_010623 [Petrolisthes cinctipes]
MKKVILMAVNDQELVQELISIIPTQELDTVVQHCYAHEAARHTTTAITSPTKAVCAISQYKKDKKAKQQSPKPLQNPNMAGICNNCGHSHGKADCPAADWTCSNCGKKGHRARAPRCSATSVVNRTIMASVAAPPREGTSQQCIPPRIRAAVCGESRTASVNPQRPPHASLSRLRMTGEQGFSACCQTQGPTQQSWDLITCTTSA